SCFSSCLLFFDGPGAPRDLHSFPTRRSSDLEQPAEPDRGPAPAPVEESPRQRVEFPEIEVREVGDDSHQGAGEQQKPVEADEPRSEEHMSELQSRENLVCRLLLEKKKISISC